LRTRGSIFTRLIVQEFGSHPAAGVTVCGTRPIQSYLRLAQAYMLISIPTGNSTISGFFQAITFPRRFLLNLRHHGAFEIVNKHRFEVKRCAIGAAVSYGTSKIRFRSYVFFKEMSLGRICLPSKRSR
jgi:hypothetical protein